MERLDGGAAARFNNHRTPPSAVDRFLGTRYEESSSLQAPPLELSEDDIFSTPSGSLSPSPTRRRVNPSQISARSAGGNDYGILAALNGNSKTGSVPRSEYDARPVFNRRASALSSLSSSLSPTPAASSRIMIPRPPPPPPQEDRVRLRHQSAPVSVPVVPKALQRKVRELEEVVWEEEDEEDSGNGMIMPPHEVVAARHSPMLASSVLEGAGRTLKGRDLRQKYFTKMALTFSPQRQFPAAVSLPTVSAATPPPPSISVSSPNFSKIAFRYRLKSARIIPKSKSGGEEENSGNSSSEEAAPAEDEMKKPAAVKEEAEGLLGGVGEEIREIEWPALGKVVGTTGVVLAVIAGSSVVLLTVNAVLAEISDGIFAGKGVQDFFG
ncbi:uncharacterized protein LOC127253481 [Andrographis paniculata]|uniref:uncharacterized protein LOC127253481 n=1 Tax=Andrographis paniculata TaxID=175694 RepID=UPI0021E92E24|nr:uncharacterized protein LOC127253481 [Andrographis paniculata]